MVGTVCPGQIIDLDGSLNGKVNIIIILLGTYIVYYTHNIIYDAIRVSIQGNKKYSILNIVFQYKCLYF